MSVSSRSDFPLAAPSPGAPRPAGASPPHRQRLSHPSGPAGFELGTSKQGKELQPSCWSAHLLPPAPLHPDLGVEALVISLGEISEKSSNCISRQDGIHFGFGFFFFLDSS